MFVLIISGDNGNKEDSDKCGKPVITIFYLFAINMVFLNYFFLDSKGVRKMDNCNENIDECKFDFLCVTPKCFYSFLI